MDDVTNEDGATRDDDVENGETEPGGDSFEEEDEAGDHESDREDEDDSEDEPVELTLEFTGNAWEYFRVWAVNTFLSLLTLGVFSAWGKVRKKRYLYSHTLIDGTPLRYLGRPIPILKGRAVAVVLVTVWYLVTRHYQKLYFPMLGVGAFVLPWIMLRTATFTARSSSYRNITFDFKSTYKDAFFLIAGGAIGTALTAGLGYPLFQHRLRRWLISSTYFGRERWRFGARASMFYRIYLGVALVTAALGIGIAVVANLVTPSSEFEDWYFVVVRALPLNPRITFGLLYLFYLGVAAIAQTWITNLVWKGSYLGPLRFTSHLRARDMLWLYASNTVLIALSLGLLSPWASLRLLRYRLRCLSIFVQGDLSELEGVPTELGSAAGAETAEVFDLDISL